MVHKKGGQDIEYYVTNYTDLYHFFQSGGIPTSNHFVANTAALLAKSLYQNPDPQNEKLTKRLLQGYRATSREEETRKSRIPLEPDTRATPTPASTDPRADSDLRDASKRGNVAAVKRILAAGRADVNSKDLNGWTPVLWAARWGHGEVVELLMRKGADVSVLTFNDNNILHVECMGSDVETVKYVLSLNVVDINARNKQGQTAFFWARNFRHRRVESLLMSIGAH
ncbi:GA-binding protein subunit beta-1-like [Haliotis rufescens]|uniref:GA-binding protein subunit beta-1-like n=1 Tax=Haliotis rufescens TaxID=6454 RepID=UPI00201EA218|nr:GA-binding protein subunit beta-1-like [Haliotis rufescens]